MLVSGVVDLGIPGVTVRATPPVEYLRVTHEGRSYVVTVVNAGLACCSVEYVSACEQWGASAQPADAADADTPALSVFVVSGTCTTKIAPLVTTMFNDMPAGTKVMSFGACTASGGPYWDSYSVVKGIGELLPVDVYVPGCPPRPEALLHGLAQLDGSGVS
jgi:NADH-quinone oxidoreductase subunit B